MLDVTYFPSLGHDLHHKCDVNYHDKDFLKPAAINLRHDLVTEAC